MKVVLFKYEKKNVISWIIHLVTRSEYSHAALITDDGSVYDSSETVGKVSYRGTLETFGNRDITVFDIPDENNKLPQYIDNTLGVKYDWKGVVGWLFKCNNRSKFYCFEYVWEWLLVLSIVESRKKQLTGDDIKDALKGYKVYHGSVTDYLTSQTK